jgi:2,5-diamino-6-(ribosylamino)-4(3H)-pyrimidinone 5'-phosphate reductase
VASSPNRPYVLLNVAASVDGKIDTVARRGTPISSPADRARVDAMRAEVDAVMVGTRTLLDEDPRLTVKSPELRAARLARGTTENPAKVSMLRRLDALRPDARFLTFGPARVFLFAPVAAGAHAFPPTVCDVEIVRLGDDRVDLPAALRHLGARGVRRLLVEGGGTLNAALLAEDLVDEVRVFVAPRILGGAGAPTLADGAGLEWPRLLRRVEVEPWSDGGVLLRYMVERS